MSNDRSISMRENHAVSCYRRRKTQWRKQANIAGCGKSFQINGRYFDKVSLNELATFLAFSTK